MWAGGTKCSLRLGKSESGNGMLIPDVVRLLNSNFKEFTCENPYIF